MSLPVVLSTKTTANGDDSTTVFNFLFKVYNTSDVKVILTSALGVEYVQVESTHYSVALTSGGGGTVTMFTAPATGEKLLIKQAIPLTQPDALSVGALPSSTLEQIADRITLLAQQVKEITDRTPQLKESTASSTPALPEPEDGKTLVWSSGNLVNAALSTTDATLIDDDTFASASSTTAASSESIKAYADAAAAAARYLSVRNITTTAGGLTTDRFISADASSAGFTYTLPEGSTLTTGHEIIVKKTDSTLNVLTISDYDSELIDEQGTTSLNTPQESVALVWNGATWFIKQRYIYSVPAAYTPNFQGFGTPSSVNFIWQRIGGSVFITGRFTCGTSTAVTGYVSLPTGLSGRTGLGTDVAVGHGGYSGTSGQDLLVLATASNGYVTFAAHDASAGGLSAQDGNALASSGFDISFFATVPIEGWKG